MLLVPRESNGAFGEDKAYGSTMSEIVWKALAGVEGRRMLSRNDMAKLYAIIAEANPDKSGEGVKRRRLVPPDHMIWSGEELKIPIAKLRAEFLALVGQVSTTVPK